jgi:hypothetical protein
VLFIASSRTWPIHIIAGMLLESCFRGARPICALAVYIADTLSAVCLFPARSSSRLTFYQRSHAATKSCSSNCPPWWSARLRHPGTKGRCCTLLRPLAATIREPRRRCHPTSHWRCHVPVCHLASVHFAHIGHTTAICVKMQGMRVRPQPQEDAQRTRSPTTASTLMLHFCNSSAPRAA